ncbi:MAG TPA: alcohol dehydrogenase catalytic domain-containing protein [Candidatus Binatia bacterium]
MVEGAAMLAFVMQQGGPRLVRDWTAAPAAHEAASLVRVRTVLAGICNTDLEIARGYMGFRGVLGHEFVGEATSGKWKGRRVVGGINFGCGSCTWCARGIARHCPQRRVLGILGADGVLAEEFWIPEANLLAVPDSVADETAVFAEPVGAACEILEQVGDTPREDALVLGAGKLGCIVAQVLAADGFRVDLVGRPREGASTKWLRDRGIRIVDAKPDRGDYPLVVEATGSTDALQAAIACTRPRGRLVLKTTVSGRHEVDLAPVVINEISIIGSRCGQFEPALAMLCDGRVDVAPLIDARYDLGDVESAFTEAARRGVRKVLVSAR